MGNAIRTTPKTMVAVDNGTSWGSELVEVPSEALAYTGSLAEGSTITITTDGTYSFGNNAPELVLMANASDVASGDLLVSAMEVGTNTTVTYPSSDPLQSVAVAGLPKDKGWICGTTGTEQNSVAYNSMTVTHTASTRIFESRISYFPQAQQDNSLQHFLGNYPGHTDPVTWGMKTIWNMSDLNYLADDTDFFLGIGGWYPAGQYFQGGLILSTNSIQTFYVPSSDVTDPASSTYKFNYPSPYQIECAYDQGTADGTTADGWIEPFVSVVGEGQIHHSKNTGLVLAEPTGTTKVINSFTYPGFLRGFNIPYDCQFYETALYKSVGVGAFCRVAICNNTDYFQADKKTLLRPDAWADNSLTMTIPDSWFDLSTPTGLHICIIGEDNTQIGAIAL